MKQINQYVSIVDEENIVSCGKYKIGKDIPSGEYYIWGNTIWYSYIRKTLRYTFENESDCYAVFEKGDKLEIEEGMMTPIENIVYMQKDKLGILLPGHVYRIEKEIPTGYYVYKFDEKYFKEEEVFLGKNECGIDIYEANSDSRFSRKRGWFGNVEINSTKRHVVIKNGIAKYYGNCKFDAINILDDQNIPFNEFYCKGKEIFIDEVIDLRLFLKHNKDSRFCGKAIIDLFYYYWYSINGKCMWMAKIRPYYGRNIQTIEMDFYADGCSIFHKKFDGFKDIRFLNDKKYGDCYVITSTLPEDYYGKRITIVLKSINEICVEETLKDFENVENYSKAKEIRNQYASEFMMLGKLLEEVGELNVEEELKYFEEVPDLMDIIVPAIKDVLRARIDLQNTSYNDGEIKFRINATYNKAFYCIAKIADEAKKIHFLNNENAYEVIFDSTQLKEIELTNYVLSHGFLEESNDFVEKFLQKRSYRYYTINRMKQCIDELNDTYGYSSKVTNSVLTRIIKNENKKMQREIDALYSDIVREKRVPTKWGNEYRLFSLISSHTVDVVYQYHCDWLGQQSLDIYISSVKIGVEYQGEQHYKAIDMWGGEEGLKKNRERDLRKKELCKANGIKLLEWSYQQPVNDDNVIKFMKENSIPFVEDSSETRIRENVMAPIIKPKEKKNSKSIKPKVSKYIIVQYDMTGRYVDQFSNIGSAAEKVGVSATSISKTLRGERNSAAGYLWKKFDLQMEIPDIVNVEFDTSKTNSGVAKKVGLMGKDGIVKQEFYSIADASRITGTSMKHIQNELAKTVSKEWKYM